MKREKMGRPLDYDNNLKLKVARDYLTGNLSYRELAAGYGLEAQTVRYFVKWYRRRYKEKPGAAVQATDDVCGQEQQSIGKAVHKALEEANLKITGLEMLIENAQKELGIDIVKKYGTKQSWK